MARHHPSASAAHQPSAQAGRHDVPVIFDAFVSDIYLPHVKLRKRSWDVDERIARQHLSPTFGDRRLIDIQRHEVEDWLRGLSGKGLAPTTCNRILAVLKTICSLAETRGLLPAGQSPCKGVSSFKIHTQRERYLSREEAQRLMRALEKSDRLEAFAIRLLLLTGARKSEILKARWENVRLDQRLLTVPLSKSGRPRHILLSDAALDILRALSLLEQAPAGIGACRCAHSRFAAYLRLFSGECRAFAVRGAEDAGARRSPHHHALCPSGTGVTAGGG